MTYKYIIKHTKKGRVSRVEQWDEAKFKVKTFMGPLAISLAARLKLPPCHEWAEGAQRTTI